MQNAMRNGILIADEAHTATTMQFKEYEQGPKSLVAVLPSGFLQRVAMSATFKGDIGNINDLKQLLGLRTTPDTLFESILPSARPDVQVLVVNANNILTPSKLGSRSNVNNLIVISAMRKLHFWSLFVGGGILVLLPTVEDCHTVRASYIQAVGANPNTTTMTGDSIPHIIGESTVVEVEGPTGFVSVINTRFGHGVSSLGQRMDSETPSNPIDIRYFVHRKDKSGITATMLAYLMKQSFWRLQTVRSCLDLKKVPHNVTDFNFAIVDMGLCEHTVSLNGVICFFLSNILPVIMIES